MFKQRGQIQIFILVLIVVGFILYANLSGSGIGKLFGSFKIEPGPSVPEKTPSPPSTISVPPPAGPVPEIPDTVSPVRFNPNPPSGSVLPPETKKITMGLETDEKATCRHSDVAGVSYDSMQGKFSKTDSTSHSVSITTLSEGTAYVYYIKCADEKGNKNSSDFVINFSVSAPVDRTPPVISNPSHGGDVLPAGTTSVVISVSTDEPASCRYSTAGSLPYSSMPGSFSYYDQTKRFHVKQITGLTNGGSYDFFVRCQDLAGNANTGDVLISFSVAQ